MAHPSGRCRTTTRRRSGQSSTHSPFFRLTDAKFLSEYTVTGVWLDSHFVPIPVVSFHDLIVFFIWSYLDSSRRTSGPHQSKDPEYEQAKRERTATYGKKKRKVKNPTVRAGQMPTPVKPMPWAAASDLPPSRPIPPAVRTAGELNRLVCLPRTTH